MRKLGTCLIGTAVTLLAFCGVAGATTLGTTTQPSGSTASKCFAVIGQLTSDPSTPYQVPAPGGQITQWSTNTSGDTAGAPLVMAVLRPTGGTNVSVVGSDPEVLPTPLPPSNVATFTLAHPITANPGDTLALYSQALSSGPTCYWSGGTTPTGDGLFAASDASVPFAGQSLNYGTDVSGGGFTLDLSANLVQDEDAGVTTTAGPSNAAAQRPALLSSTVSNAGPGTEPITFVDHVPSGLSINSASAGNGTCSTSGQTVTCTISGLGAGQSVPVNVVVTPAASGTYSNSVSVSVPITDTNAANNTATATLAATAPAPTPKCVVPKLKNTPSKVAKTVLKDLGCKVKTSKAHSKSVRKGNVIKTKPGAGTHPFGTTVKVQVSSGPSKKKHETRHAPRR
jgi:Domain of unknown function DUF11/PASTA domain